MARPALPANERRSMFIAVRFTPEEHQRILRRVKLMNDARDPDEIRVSPGTLVRALAIKALDEREEREAQRKEAARKADRG
jgi:hypothetical protein